MDCCLFCKNSGPFNTKEHIVPESLGNDSDIIKHLVCDKCQNYLSREVEAPALNKTPLAVWRTLLGIKTKKGKFPSISLSPPSGGRIPAQHNKTDVVNYTAHEDGSTSVDIDNPDLINAIMQGNKNKFNLVLSPWHLGIIGRLLGKMGIEYLASKDISLAMDSQFDELRMFVREGSINKIWPLFWAQEGSLRNLRYIKTVNKKYYEEEIECYRYSLGYTNIREYIFTFSIGIDIITICLTHRQPLEKFKNIIEGVKLECIWYPDNSW